MSNLFWKIWSVLVYARRFGGFGRRTWIRHPLVIQNPKWITIGNNCLIRDGARLEIVERQDLPPGRITIGNNVTMEQGAHIVSAGSITIEDDVAFGPRCTLVDTPHPVGKSGDGNRARVVSSAQTSIHLERRVFLGANVVVLEGVRIGANSIIGANSVVTRDIPADSIAAGSPARVIRRIEQ